MQPVHSWKDSQITDGRCGLDQRFGDRGRGAGRQRHQTPSRCRFSERAAPIPCCARLSPRVFWPAITISGVSRFRVSQTLPGEWQVPDTYFDTTALNDDPEELGKYKQLTRPGEGKWRPDWEAGWVCKQSTGLWAVDVDDPEAFRRRMEMLGIEPPRTWAQSTGRVGGGTHLLFDGRDLPEQYWLRAASAIRSGAT